MSQSIEQMQVVSQAAINPNQAVTQVALFHPDGTVLTVVDTTTEKTAATMLLTGYAIGTAAALAASDTVNGAFAKLEKRVLDLENA